MTRSEDGCGCGCGSRLQQSPGQEAHRIRVPQRSNVKRVKIQTQDGRNTVRVWCVPAEILEKEDFPNAAPAVALSVLF